MKRVTLKDVAEKAGVSMTLASFVIREKPDGFGNITVRPELREKIKAVAKELNYTPHRSAQALRTGKSRVIGVVSAHSDHPLSFSKTYEICESILRRGYDYLLQQVDWTHVERVSKTIDMLLDYSIDGIVVMNAPFHSLPEVDMNRLKAMRLPMVGVSAVSYGNYPLVSVDYKRATFEMTRAVVAKGRRRLAIVARKSSVNLFHIRQRLDGILDACSEINDVSVDTFVFNDEETIKTSADIETGYKATLNVLESSNPDAIFYTNDFMAFGALQACTEKGIRVPEDIFICGFDGLEITRYSNPPITTAIQPTKILADKAVELLFDMMDNGTMPTHSLHLVPCEIAYRQSTGDR